MSIFSLLYWDMLLVKLLLETTFANELYLHIHDQVSFRKMDRRGGGGGGGQNNMQCISGLLNIIEQKKNHKLLVIMYLW